MSYLCTCIILISRINYSLNANFIMLVLTSYWLLHDFSIFNSNCSSTPEIFTICPLSSIFYILFSLLYTYVASMQAFHESYFPRMLFMIMLLVLTSHWLLYDFAIFSISPVEVQFELLGLVGLSHYVDKQILHTNSNFGMQAGYI